MHGLFSFLVDADGIVFDEDNASEILIRAESFVNDRMGERLDDKNWTRIDSLLTQDGRLVSRPEEDAKATITRVEDAGVEWIKWKKLALDCVATSAEFRGICPISICQDGTEGEKLDSLTFEQLLSELLQDQAQVAAAEYMTVRNVLVAELPKILHDRAAADSQPMHALASRVEFRPAVLEGGPSLYHAKKAASCVEFLLHCNTFPFTTSYDATPYDCRAFDLSEEDVGDGVNTKAIVHMDIHT